MTRQAEPIKRADFEIPLATVTVHVDPIDRANSESSETNEEALGVAEEHGTNPYADLEDLEEVMVQVATEESIHDISMIGSSGFKPT